MEKYDYVEINQSHQHFYLSLSLLFIRSFVLYMENKKGNNMHIFCGCLVTHVLCNY